MSISGEVNFQPNGDLFGAVAGKINVNLQPGKTLTHVYPPRDDEGNIMLNFPMEDVESAVFIRTWEIRLE